MTKKLKIYFISFSILALAIITSSGHFASTGQPIAQFICYFLLLFGGIYNTLQHGVAFLVMNDKITVSDDVMKEKEELIKSIKKSYSKGGSMMPEFVDIALYISLVAIFCFMPMQSLLLASLWAISGYFDVSARFFSNKIPTIETEQSSSKI